MPISPSSSAQAARERVAQRLRELRADAGITGTELAVRCGPIPGDDGEDELYAPEHPAAQVLLLITTAVPDLALHTRLGSVEGLIRLNHETV